MWWWFRSCWPTQSTWRCFVGWFRQKFSSWWKATHIREARERRVWLTRTLRRFASRRVDGFLTNNRGGERYLKEQLLVPAAKIKVRPYLVSEIQMEQDAGQSLRDIPKDKTNANKVTFLYVGQLIERKGLLPLLEAIDLLPQKIRSQMEVWLVGDGNQHEKIQKRILERGLSSVVRLMGRRPYEELARYYQAANVFVMPTLDDYRALVGFEAISMGLPMLHSVYDGAHFEVVDPGKNGQIYDPPRSEAGG